MQYSVYEDVVNKRFNLVIAEAVGATLRLSTRYPITNKHTVTVVLQIVQTVH